MPVVKITGGLPLAAQVVGKQATAFVKEINHKLVQYTCALYFFYMLTHTHCKQAHTE